MPSARVQRWRLVPGWSVRAALVVSDEAVDFGSVAPGCRALTRTIRLTNTCLNNQTISSISLTPSPEFQLGSVPSLPLTVGLGLTASFTVSYRPNNLGPDTATLGIDGTQRVIALSGAGGSAVNVASFRVPSKTDVLLVLDNSCSMSEEQAALSSNPGALFGFAFDAGVDFTSASRLQTRQTAARCSAA